MTTPPPLTKKILANVQIVASDQRDKKRPHLCKVVAIDEAGRRGDPLSDEHKDRAAAEQWIRAASAMAPGE